MVFVLPNQVWVVSRVTSVSRFNHHQLKRGLRLIEYRRFVYRNFRLQLKKIDEGVPDLASIDRSLIRDGINQPRRPGGHLVDDQFAGESENQNDQQEN